ncbi:MAG TPA: 3-methyl-2-oxobutanoate hydroxymethyltransferase, partial [Candidatus Binatia bacterium]|nr:3-methyl-2-oxobutanoate hydroxymethyltransferase [Candidatus Binatia bacterium]
MSATPSSKITVPEIQRFKAAGQKITALTAYDYPFARILDACGIDVLLVGDSLGTVVQGIDTTLPVTMDEIVYHLKLVSRARPRALVVGDMPFLSYQAGICDAIA